MHKGINIYYLLYLSFKSEEHIRKVLINDCNIPAKYIQSGMHLTLYHCRRPMPLLEMNTTYLSIESNISETRFMVLAPGGENPRPDLIPAQRSIGIRLTRRNNAIEEIIKLRRSAYQYEPEFKRGYGKGKRVNGNTTDWRNAFGAFHYQPHIKLIRPGTAIDRDLGMIGDAFRKKIKKISFSKAEYKVYK